MIRVDDMILNLKGVIVRKAEAVTHETALVYIRPRHITAVFTTRFVTARVEHIPNTCLNMGLLYQIPSSAIFFEETANRSSESHLDRTVLL